MAALKTSYPHDTLRQRLSRYSFFLLDWYKSTNTDAEGAGRLQPIVKTHLQHTLGPHALPHSLLHSSTPTAPGAAATAASEPSAHSSRCSFCLLYWYKSTNSDAHRALAHSSTATATAAAAAAAAAAPDAAAGFFCAIILYFCTSKPSKLSTTRARRRCSDAAPAEACRHAR